MSGEAKIIFCHGPNIDILHSLEFHWSRYESVLVATGWVCGSLPAPKRTSFYVNWVQFESMAVLILFSGGIICTVGCITEGLVMLPLTEEDSGISEVSYSLSYLSV